LRPFERDENSLGRVEIWNSSTMARTELDKREKIGEALESPASIREEKSRWGRIWLSTGVVFVLAMAILIPTLGDLGLTWDEPAYRYSQIMSAQWWEKLANARSWAELKPLFEADQLIYYWPYARFGINFHPPLAGQMNLATHALFGGIMKDYPARRIATALEFALTLVIGCHFLSKRYGATVGLLMAGCLFLTPRLFGQAHLVDTDIPGLFLWASTALAFWNGLHSTSGRRWRILVGVLLGLCFIEKMAAVTVILPIMAWLIAGHFPFRFWRKSARPGLVDGLITSIAMLVPLGLAYLDIQMLLRQLPHPLSIDFFADRPIGMWNGTILAVPLFVWLIRRGAGRWFSRSPIWGVERPALETWTSILAFAPLVGWLGNPGWWRETLPRMAHYYWISKERRGVLPDIQILYAGQVYEFSLPWENAWVLIGITVPAGILLASIAGLIWSIRRFRKDLLPAYFLVHLVTLPALRMLPTPAHDGVRLLLPTFFFLSAFAAWGIVATADLVAQSTRLRPRYALGLLSFLVLGSAAVETYRIHPYELSYYNELIGGPRGAWNRGFEMTYWFDAFDDKVLAELNRELPPRATLDFLNDMTNQTMVFTEHQSLGHIRADLQLGGGDGRAFPFVWLLSQDSKATAFTRLLYAMRPWYGSTPRQLDGMRVATVADPTAVSRAWALQLFLDAPDPSPPALPAAPVWIRSFIPPLARLWGDGLTRAAKPTINAEVLNWARSDPASFKAAAEELATTRTPARGTSAYRLLKLIEPNYDTRGPQSRMLRLRTLWRLRPQAFLEAVKIILDHPDELVTVMTRYAYIDPLTIGGYLDRDLDQPAQNLKAE